MYKTIEKTKLQILYLRSMIRLQNVSIIILPWYIYIYIYIYMYVLYILYRYLKSTHQSFLMMCHLMLKQSSIKSYYGYLVCQKGIDSLISWREITWKKKYLLWSTFNKLSTGTYHWVQFSVFLLGILNPKVSSSSFSHKMVVC